LLELILCVGSQAVRQLFLEEEVCMIEYLAFLKDT